MSIKPTDSPKTKVLDKSTVLSLISRLSSDLSSFEDKSFIRKILIEVFEIESPVGVKSKDASSLSKKEKKVLLAQALKSKAEKAGLSPSEVKLTPKEEKSALSARPEVEPKFSKDDSQKEKSKKIKGETKVLDPEVAVKTALRRTRRTRIDNIKKRLTSYDPASQAEPCFLHLVRYENTFQTLLIQWAVFQRDYDTHLMKSPFLGIRKLSYHADLQDRFDKAIKDLPQDLQKTADYEISYIKLEKDGNSFFDGDKPGVACPKSLKPTFRWPEPAKGELEDEERVSETKEW